MNAKTWMPLTLALVLGVIAAVVARRALHPRTVTGAPETIAVVVAKGEIPPGHSLSGEDVTLQQIAAKKAPIGSFTNPSEVVGRVTSAPMLTGQPLMETLLTARGTPAGLQALVPPGMRAITLDVSESSSVGGLLVPGSKVDVVSTTLDSQRPEKTLSRIIAEDIPVVAVGQQLGASKPEGDKAQAVSRTVTLLVSPHDADALDVGTAAGRLRLILRGSGDGARSRDAGVTLVELRGDAQTAPAVEPVTQLTPPPQVVLVNPPSPQTQPSVFGNPGDESPAAARVLTVITGNDERRVLFSQPRSTHTEITDTPQGELIQH